MVKFSDGQIDALKEICNVGMSKAAKQLSILLDSHIDISIPNLQLLNSNKVLTGSIFDQHVDLSYVSQGLSQNIDGQVILVFNREHATFLTESVIGKAPKMTQTEIRACEREAMLEIGNIIISSCMSAVVNMLNMTVKLTVPKYGEDDIVTLFNEQLAALNSTADEALLITTKLETKERNISGHLILLLTTESVDHLLTELHNLFSE